MLLFKETSFVVVHIKAKMNPALCARLVMPSEAEVPLKLSFLSKVWSGSGFPGSRGLFGPWFWSQLDSDPVERDPCSECVTDPSAIFGRSCAGHAPRTRARRTPRTSRNILISLHFTFSPSYLPNFLKYKRFCVFYLLFPPLITRYFTLQTSFYLLGLHQHNKNKYNLI